MHDAERHAGGLADRFAWIVIPSASLTPGFVNTCLLIAPDVHYTDMGNRLTDMFLQRFRRESDGRETSN